MTTVLPQGWSVAYLGDVFDILDHLRKPINADERATRVGDVPYYGATGQVGWIDGHLFNEELILLGEDGAPFLESHKPKAYVIRGKSWVNNHAHVLRAPSSTPSSFWKNQLDIVAYTPFVSGTTRMKLPQGRMKQIPLLVPPYKEQHRLTEALDSYLSRLDDAIASLERVHNKLKAYRASVLKAAMEGRLVPTEAALARAEKHDYEPAEALLARTLEVRRRRWEEAELAKLTARGNRPKDGKWKAKYEEPAAPDTSKLTELPQGWCWARLDQVVLSLDQGWSPQCEKRPSFDIDEWAVMKTTAIQHMGYLENENKAITKKLKPRPELELQAGDLLVTRAGPRVRVGVCCLVRATRRRIMLCDKAYRLRTADELVSPGYLEIVLNSPPVLGEIERRKTGISDSGVNLTQKRFLEMAIPLPPRAVQAKIEQRVSQQFSVVEQVSAAALLNARRCTRLRQAVLRWAFEGKLVDHDPNDEPADELLARIRAERVALDATKKSRDRKAKRTE